MRPFFRKAKDRASSLVGKKDTGNDYRNRPGTPAHPLKQLHDEILRRLSDPSRPKIYVPRSSSNDHAALLQTLQDNHSTMESSTSSTGVVMVEGAAAVILEQSDLDARIRQISKKLHDILSAPKPSLDEGLVDFLAICLCEEKQYRDLVPNLAIDLSTLLLLSIDKESHSAQTQVELLCIALADYVIDNAAAFDKDRVQMTLELCLSYSVRETASGAAALANMGGICAALYKSTQLRHWLDSAIEMTRRAIDMQDRVCRDDTAQKPRIESLFETHGNLAAMLLLRLDDRDQDLDEAVAHCKLALDLALTDEVAQRLLKKVFEILYNSLTARNRPGFAARFELISASLGVLQSTPNSCPSLSKKLLLVLMELSSFYSFRHVEVPKFNPNTGKRLKDKPVVTDCFENTVFKAVQDQIKDEIEKINSGRSAREVQASFAESSDYYYAAYENKSAFGGLALAIELGKISVILSRPGEEARNKALLSQAEKLMEHVRCTSHHSYIAAAFHYAETSLADMSDDSTVDYLNALRRYGRLLLGAYEQIYAIGLLDDAIKLLHKYTDFAMPDKARIGASDNISWLHAMQTLARCYEARFLREHNLTDLKLATWITETACEFARKEGYFAVERNTEVGVSLLWTYGKVLFTRYRFPGTPCSGNTIILKRCISYLGLCMKLTSIHHMEWPDRSETLSDAYRELMKVENRLLNRTQAMLRLEIPYRELKAEGNEYWNVSDALGMSTLFEKSLESPARFTSGTFLQTGVVEVRQRRMKFACYARIANKFASFLEECAQAERDSIEIAAEEQGGKPSRNFPPHPAAGACMQNILDRAYGKQYGPVDWCKSTSTSELKYGELWLRNALKYYREVAESPECIALERITAAFRASKLLVTDGNEHEAWELIDRAVKNLADVEFLALTLKDQECLLQRLSGLPGWAAALALRAEKTACEVMELLEMTRARITGVALDLRRDTSLLADTDPEKAAEYKTFTESLLSRGRIGAKRIVVFERKW